MSRATRTLFLGGILIMVVSCRARSPHVHIVLPDGFRGYFLIYPNQPDGAKIEPNGDEYTVQIPKGGVLRIQGDGPFLSWHSRSAAFENGMEIPMASHEENLPQDKVAFWGGGTRSENHGPMHFYYFVGTEAEHKSHSSSITITPGSVK
jgi:hypothetical protein